MSSWLRVHDLMVAVGDLLDLPQVTVQFTGTTISGPGKTRKLGAADAVAYTYDAARKEYVAR